MHNLEPDNSKDNIKHPDFNNNNINNINRNIKNDDTNNNVQHLNFNNNNNNILNGDANNNIFNNIRENNINGNTNHINKINVNRNINQVNNNINLGNKNTNSFEKQVTVQICIIYYIYVMYILRFRKKYVWTKIFAIMTNKSENLPYFA